MSFFSYVYKNTMLIYDYLIIIDLNLLDIWIGPVTYHFRALISLFRIIYFHDCYEFWYNLKKINYVRIIVELDENIDRFTRF